MDAAMYQPKTSSEDATLQVVVNSSNGEVEEGRAVPDPELDSRITRKIDLHLVPILVVMFMLAYIDRSNLGNAKIEGMLADLHMVKRDYNVASLVFYVFYILFEVPSNLILRRLSPSTWLSALLFFWGISAMSQGLTRSFGGLVCARVFIGVFEAGFTPGFLYLFSMYYTRYQLQRRLSLMFASGIVAGAFSGLLAYALVKMDGIGGYAGWRWIFIIEGLVTILVAFAAKFLIVDWPHEAKFLTQAERDRLLERLENDASKGVARMDTLDKAAFRRIIGDWKIYVGALMYFGAVTTGYVIALFLPTILKELGYTASKAQIFSIPIYLVAATSMLTFATLTDKVKMRYPFILLGCAIATVGYCILLAQGSVSIGVRYMAVFFIAAGGHSTHPITLGWLANNVSGQYKRAISTAIQISIGNCAGFVGSNIFIDSQAPRFKLGYGVSLACIWLCVVSATVFVWGMKQENRARDQGKRDSRLRLPPSEVQNLGDDHPSWRYSY